jgi:hypothetical protein
MSIVIVSGSNRFEDGSQFEKILRDNKITITTLITTGNRGASIVAEQYAARNTIPCYCYNKGYNSDMQLGSIIKYAHMMLIFGAEQDSQSKKFIRLMRASNKPILMFPVNEREFGLYEPLKHYDMHYEEGYKLCLHG